MRLKSILTALTLTLIAPFAQAQSAFSPAITVNDQVITGYELNQRAKLLDLFRTPGNSSQIAREQLIEDRLKQQTMAGVMRGLTAEELATEVEAFAGRANLTTEQFVTILNQSGVEKSTLEAFVEIGVTWRDYIRTRFSSRAQITDAEVDRAIAQTGDAATCLLYTSPSPRDA